MLFRSMFMSQIKPGASGEFQAALQDPQLKNLLIERNFASFAAFELEGIACAYIEAKEEVVHWDWPAAAKEHLELWPGKPEARSAVRMPDIFHDGVPANAAAWREGRRIESKIGCLLRLKPDMYASYIFYHFQLQEEKPESFNKTYMIGTYDSYIFSYQEVPGVVSEIKPEGLLRTNHTPDDWQSVMLPHFEPWPDKPVQERYWRAMNLLYTYDAE